MVHLGINMGKFQWFFNLSFLDEAETNLGFRNNDKSSFKLILVSIQEFLKRLNLGNRPFVLKPQKNHTVMGSFVPIDHFAKIFVIRDEYPVFGKCLGQNVMIRDAFHFLIN